MSISARKSITSSGTTKGVFYASNKKFTPKKGFTMGLQLRISKHQRIDLKRVAEVDLEKLDAVQAKLDQLEKPAIHPQELIKELDSLVGEGNAESLTRQLLQICGIIRQSGEPVHEVFMGIRNAIEHNGKEVNLTLDSWDKVAPRIESLVQNHSIKLSVTGVELSYDYANLIQRSKILTDIRPLFNETADDIEGAVISYTLRLRYDNADGENELSIALDESDINRLIDQCQ